MQRCTEPTRTNSPITFVSSFRSSLSRHTGSRLWGFRKHKRRRRGGATPLPIPNREVKPACADGTARKGGRAGGCRLWGATTDRSMVTSCRRRPFLFCTPAQSLLILLPSFLPVLAAAETGSKCTGRINVLFRWKKHGRPPRNALQGMPVCFLHGKSTYCRQPFMQGNVVLQHFADNNFSDEARKTAKTFQKKISCGHAAIG